MTKRNTLAPSNVHFDDLSRSRPVSRADLARAKGVSRGAVTMAARPGGPLAPACLAGGFIDAAHPACLRWLHPGHHRVADDQALSIETIAAAAGITPEELAADLAGPLGAALLPAHHVSAAAFASLCGVELAEVELYALADLGAAVTPQGRIDIGHEEALVFAARHPYQRDEDGEPVGVPPGVLAPACVDDDHIDTNAPHARHYLARCLGRVPTAEDLAP